MDSVFIFARTYLGIDTGWGFATGAPTGLVRDPWNIRLVPHYWLGAFFVLAHLAAGARAVMMAHGVSKALADRLMVGGAVLAGLVATVIMLGMCGMRVRFVWIGGDAEKCRQAAHARSVAPDAARGYSHVSLPRSRCEN